MHRKTILLVEDEVILAMTEKMNLEKYGYTVLIDNSGEKSVQTVGKTAEIDLVLMDIDLGKGIDGTQAAEQILSVRDIPVVFLSSHTEPEVVEKTEKITSYGYVVKNSSITVLDASIKMAFKLFDAKIKAQRKETILHEQEEKYRLLHENAGIGIGYYNLDGIVLSYNQLAAKNMNGVPEDFIGKSLYDLFPGEAARFYHERIKKAAVSTIPDVYQDLVPLPTGNLYFLSTFTKITDVNGKLLGIQIISQDITDRKLAEIAVQTKNEEYEVVNEELRSTTDELQTQNEQLYKAQEQLRESEDRLTQAERAAKIGNWTLQLDSKTMLASKGAHAIYGADFTTMTLAEIQAMALPEYRPLLNKALADLIAENSPYDLEFRTCRPCDGKIVDIHSTATYDSITNSVFGVIQDITHHSATVTKYRDMVDRFDLLLNSVTEGIYGVDEQENCTFCNESCLKLLGYARQEELLGKNMHRLIHGKHADGSVYPVEKCLIAQNFGKGIGVHIDDEVFWRSDGTAFHAEYWSNPQLQDGKATSAVMSFLDITGRKKVEQQLTESEEKFRKLSTFAFEGIVIHRNGIGIDANQSLTELLGYERTEFAGMNLFKIIHPDFHALVKENIVRDVATPYQIRAVRKNGTDFSAEIEGKNIHYNGEFFRVACVRDITERKKTEEKIRSLLAEKELLLKEVHHRIKNNMNTIYGLLALQAESLQDPYIKNVLSDAGSRVKSMLLLYDKLYRSSSYNELSVAEYVPPLIDEILSNFPDSRHVTVDAQIDDFMIETGKLQPLGIIINELLTNIMKYAFAGRDGGTITIIAAEKEHSVILTIADNGNGMPDSVDFDHPAGFGLILVNGLAKQLNGKIHIQRDQGTSIMLEFPK